MSEYGQRELMRELYRRFNGDRSRVLEEYAKADQQGLVRRVRKLNNTSSEEYAVRLWANGVYHGWLDELPNRKTTHHLSSTIEAVSYPEFENGLRGIALAWKQDIRRPQPKDESLRYWSVLVRKWCTDSSLPLPIRKTGDLGFLIDHPSGRKCFSCDNSPAHWSFLGCFLGETPSLDDVYNQIQTGSFPSRFASSKKEKELKASGRQVCGGYLASSIYGQVNRFPDGNQYKLCHLEAVGLGTRGNIEEFTIDRLIEHSIKLLDPANMIVVPLQYSGVGECEVFLREFND